MKHEDGSSREPNEFGVGVFVRPITGVHISSDRGDRRNLAKRADDTGMPNISAVNDLIDAGQTALGLNSPCVSEMIPILNVIDRSA